MNMGIDSDAIDMKILSNNAHQPQTMSATKEDENTNCLKRPVSNVDEEHMNKKLCIEEEKECSHETKTGLPTEMQLNTVPVTAIPNATFKLVDGIKYLSVKSACTCCRKSRVKCNKLLPCERCRRLGLECKPQLRGRGRPPAYRSRVQRPPSPSTTPTIQIINQHAVAISPSVENRKSIHEKSNAGHRGIQQSTNGTYPMNRSSIHQPKLSHLEAQQKLLYGMMKPKQYKLPNNSEIFQINPLLNMPVQPNHNLMVLQQQQAQNQMLYKQSVAATIESEHHQMNQMQSMMSPCQNNIKAIDICIQRWLQLRQTQPMTPLGVQSNLRLLAYISVEENSQDMQVKILSVAKVFRVNLDDIFTRKRDSSLDALNERSAMRNVPADSQLRSIWNTPDSSYWERTIMFGKSATFCNERWQNMVYSPQEAYNMKMQNQGDLLSGMIHPNDLPTFYTSLADSCFQNGQQFTSCQTVRCKFRMHATYQLCSINVHLFVASHGGIAHMCVKVTQIGNEQMHTVPPQIQNTVANRAVGMIMPSPMDMHFQQHMQQVAQVPQMDATGAGFTHPLLLRQMGHVQPQALASTSQMTTPPVSFLQPNVQNFGMNGIPQPQSIAPPIHPSSDNSIKVPVSHPGTQSTMLPSFIGVSQQLLSSVPINSTSNSQSSTNSATIA